MLKEYGVTTGKPIDSGFVFYDGKYIESPYVVGRRGGEVYINDQWVYHTGGTDKPPFVTHPEKATLPAEIDKNTSFYDKRVAEYISNTTAAMRARNAGLEEERKVMEAAYRTLPRVKEAEFDKSYPGLLHITTYRGETLNIQLNRRRCKPRTDSKSRFEEAENWREFLEKGLRDGHCLFLFSRGGLTSLANAQKNLPTIMRALRSDDSIDKKAANLMAAGFRWAGEPPFRPAIAACLAPQSPGRKAKN